MSDDSTRYNEYIGSRQTYVDDRHSEDGRSSSILYGRGRNTLFTIVEGVNQLYGEHR
jgi:hypothetical protein